MKRRVAVVLAVCLLGSVPPVLAWSGHTTTESGLTLTVAPLAPIVDPMVPTRVTATVTNDTAVDVAGELTVRDFVDGWRCRGASVLGVTVPAGGTEEVSFEIVSGPPVYDALYPVHVYAALRRGGEVVDLHAVRVFEVRRRRDQPTVAVPGELPVHALAPDAALPLWLLDTPRVAWRYVDGPWRYKPVGWTGSDETSRASMTVRSVTRGDTRDAVNMHPPWTPAGGTVVCDYRLSLPAECPIALVFATAIRDHAESEPPSDGVLFRVQVAESADAGEGTVVFERFSAAKQWEEGRVDLSSYAGRTVTLRLESHPGPAHNTTCDSSYWAQPVVAAGTAVSATRDEGRVGADDPRLMAALRWDGTSDADSVTGFDLTDDAGTRVAKAVLIPGAKGVLDGRLGFVLPDGAAVSAAGLEVDVEGGPVGRWPSVHTVRAVRAVRENGGLRVDHELLVNGRETVLRVTLRAEGRVLRLAASCRARITRIALGPWSQTAPRVYYGHGYCIEEPQAFRAGFGGHNLAASHVGVDFGSGISVLQALDTPPTVMDVTPARRRYALVGRANSTLTLVPGRNAFECAVGYRPFYDKSAAAGVPRLAGRFCFDIWGGRYAEIAERMEDMFRYGLTDSFLTVHNWQRWGYDYRLPDIWPPNPAFGTVADMRRIGEVCRRHDVPWGLHDNYIDFYPDARDYSYAHVYFTADGRPHRAWYNRGRDAQSYKWRPDHILPFVQRNYRLIRAGVAPTHSFLDVFTSSGCVDYWDHTGSFHSGLGTRRCWGETFAWIRDFLGGNAPTTSEAGHDQLIGYLDGADCQWLTLAEQPRKHVLAVRCADWERVPWYDAVNHHRFILHGVGYSGRYQGGRSRLAHGINSDDYVSAEILSGHALMADAASWGRPAVRKYWLAQQVARRLAGARIAAVTFVGDDIHRQRVTWDNGVDVSVNRGEMDWSVDGCVLPTYGFCVRDGAFRAALERRDGAVAESCFGEAWAYVNARTRGAEETRRLPIRPGVRNLRYTGGNTFSWTMVWDADVSAPTDDRIFVHFSAAGGAGSDEIHFQDDHDPPVPPTQWQGVLTYERTVELPDDAAGPYRVCVGMYGENGRALLQGNEVDSARYWVATLTVERDGDGTARVTMEPAPEVPRERPPERNAAGTMVEWTYPKAAGASVLRTDGAFRIDREEDSLRLMPLPGQGTFRVEMKLAAGRRRPRPVVVAQTDPQADPIPVLAQYDETGWLRFEVDADAFACRVRW